MAEVVYRILAFAQYCAEQGIADIKKFRKSLKPLFCVFTVAGREFISEELYQKGLQLVAQRQFEAAQKRAETRERGIKSPSEYRRTVTNSAKWIADTKTAIATEEQAFAKATDPGNRYETKQKLVKLRSKLAKQEAAYSDSLAFMKEFLGDEGTSG